VSRVSVNASLGRQNLEGWLVESMCKATLLSRLTVTLDLLPLINFSEGSCIQVGCPMLS